MPNKIYDKAPQKRVIIEALLKGYPVTVAARKAELSRAEAYVWRDEDAVFAKAWDEAVAEGVELLEEEARRRAVDGYNDRPVFGRDGAAIAWLKDYSDGLLTLL